MQVYLVVLYEVLYSLVYTKYGNQALPTICPFESCKV